MKTIQEMSTRQIRSELRAIDKFMDSAPFLGDPAPYEIAADRQVALLDELESRPPQEVPARQLSVHQTYGVLG